METRELFLKLKLGFLFLVTVLLSGCAEPVSKEDIQALKVAKASNISPRGELAEMFFFSIHQGRTTDLMREEKLKELKGNFVLWELTVEDVEKITETKIKVTTGIEPEFDVRRGDISVSNQEAHVSAHVFTQNSDDLEYLLTLRRGDSICLKGKLNGQADSLDRLLMRPAILCRHDESSRVSDSAISIKFSEDGSDKATHRSEGVEKAKSKEPSEVTFSSIAENNEVLRTRNSGSGVRKELFQCRYGGLNFSLFLDLSGSREVYGVTINSGEITDSVYLSEADLEIPMSFAFEALGNHSSNRYQIEGSGRCRAITADITYKTSRFLLSEEVCGAAPPEGPPQGAVALVREKLQDGTVREGSCMVISESPGPPLSGQNQASSSTPINRDGVCDQMIGLMRKARVSSDICPQSRDGYVREFLLYSIQLPERCGGYEDEQYLKLIQAIDNKLKEEISVMGTEGFCESNRPYGG